MLKNMFEKKAGNISKCACALFRTEITRKIMGDDFYFFFSQCYSREFLTFRTFP